MLEIDTCDGGALAPVEIHLPQCPDDDALGEATQVVVNESGTRDDECIGGSRDGRRIQTGDEAHRSPAIRARVIGNNFHLHAGHATVAHR